MEAMYCISVHVHQQPRGSGTILPKEIHSNRDSLRSFFLLDFHDESFVHVNWGETGGLGAHTPQVILGGN